MLLYSYCILEKKIENEWISQKREISTYYFFFLPSKKSINMFVICQGCRFIIFALNLGKEGKEHFLAGERNVLAHFSYLFARVPSREGI